MLGFFTASDEETAPRAFWGSLGLVVATSAILLQTFNPDWLSHIVFYVRVFFAHVLLVLALARFLQLAKNAQ